MIRIHLHQFRPPKADEARDEAAAMAFKAEALKFKPVQDATVSVLERVLAARQYILARLDRQYRTGEQHDSTSFNA